MESARKKLPELLAPAGGRKAFLGAVKAGADAVYLGGEKFGARAYAENFTKEEIIQSIREAHILGRKVYLTLNVLTKESELDETLEFAMSLYREGLDGVIVQDLGVLSALHEKCPGLELHASTQMSVSGPESVHFLKQMGVKRVVPARELSLEEIRTIKREEPIDIECFIHGAMCYSYSGRCLLSSFLGGRSGNRGRCAGTCRLPYRILDESRKEISLGPGKGEKYPLSMRDMCVLEILPDLIDAGIDSFKIEGRMKSPHYAAGVTALYRKYIDYYVRWDAAGRKKPWKVSQEDMRRLRSLYLRSELSTGYYYRRNGRELLTITKPGYTGTDEAVLQEIEKEYLDQPLKKVIRGRAVLEPGRNAQLTVSAVYEDRTVEITAEGDTVQEALKRPMSPEEISKRLKKTGDSVFTFSDLEVETGGDLFLPVASLNSLRREALILLEEKILGETSRAHGPHDGPENCADRGENGIIPAENIEIKTNTDSPEGPDHGDGGSPEIWAQVLTVPQLDAALKCGVRRIVVEETPEIMAYIGRNGSKGLYMALPPVFRRGSLGGIRKLTDHPEKFEGFMVRNLEELAFLEREGYSGQIIADGTLYQWNSEAGKVLGDHVTMLNTGWELSAKDMEPLFRENRGRQLVPVYGRIPMMITAGCVRKTAGKCSHTEKELYFLEDRKGMKFPVRCFCGHCSNVIYNSLPLSLHTFVIKNDPLLMSAAGWILSFTTESREETERILRFFMTHGRESGEDRIFRDFTTGHYRKSAI